MSGITSTFPDYNSLYDAARVDQAIQGHKNALLTQEHNQQLIGQADIEMVARAASPLLNMSEEEAARAYPGVISYLNSQGYGKHAPPTYPGHAVTQHLVSMGIPADKQFEYGAGRTAASGAASGLGLGGPGGGGGGAAGDGAATGPVMGPRGPGSATRGEAEGGPPAPGSPGAAVAQRTYDFWKSKGFSDPIIAGIMAGGPGSESDFTPSVYGDNRSSYGLYQHHGPRLDNMRKHFGLTGDAMPTEQQQNEYAYWEISPQGPLAHVGVALANAKTPEEAATIWTRDFGVPADKTEIGRRARGAGRYAGRYGGAAAAPGVPGVQVGGVPPPPPGGPAGAAAPAGPGGFAAALAPPAVAAAPAPGQRVSSNVGAILGGMQQARTATPASAMPMVAGPGGAGPEVQPLRPVEAGWGTGTPGSYGYSGGSPTPGTVPAPAPAPAPVPAAQPPAAPAQPAAPQVPLAPVLPLKPSGLTAQQEEAALNDLNAPGIKVADVNRITAHYQALAAQNRTYNEQAAQHNYERQRQAAADVETRAQHAATAAQRDIENKRAEAAAAALAEQRRLENARAGVPTAQQRNPATGVLEPMPGYRGATADERIDYSLKHDDPSSQDYADAWKARKWQIAPNGSVIEQDMSGYPPPTRSIQRPTFLPQPTGTALDEVRKADTDARVIVPAINRYVDLHKEIGGSSWGAYFDNPRDPKAQQLIGAFNAMKTVLRSPAYANTGVLQPAEMEMLKQELVSPQTIRGLYATPQALEARLHEIKFAILSRQDAELRSVGKDGVIVRDKSDLAKIPDGGKFYDEDGNLRVKTRAE